MNFTFQYVSIKTQPDYKDTATVSDLTFQYVSMKPSWKHRADYADNLYILICFYENEDMTPHPLSSHTIPASHKPRRLC